MLNHFNAIVVAQINYALKMTEKFIPSIYYFDQKIINFGPNNRAF